MIYLAIALSLASSSSGAIDDREILTAVNQFAHKLGLQDLKIQYTEKSVAPAWGSPSKPAALRSLECLAPDGKTYTVNVIPPARIITFVRDHTNEEGTSHEKSVLFDPIHPPKEYDPQPMGVAAMKAIGAKGPYVYRPMRVANSHLMNAAVFDMTVAGHRFFNISPAYSYEIFLNLKTSEVLGVSMPAPLPAVNATVAKVEEQKAKDLLSAWAKRNAEVDTGSMMLLNGHFGSVTLVPELGYYKFPNESKATLVWQGRVITDNPKQMFHQEFCLGICVDALTGELIAPDQTLIN